jgi:hypothetical protein
VAFQPVTWSDRRSGERRTAVFSGSLLPSVSSYHFGVLLIRSAPVIFDSHDPSPILTLVFFLMVDGYFLLSFSFFSSQGVYGG